MKIPNEAKTANPTPEQQPSATQGMLPSMPTFVRSGDFKSYYTNNVVTAVTPFDIVLLIGETDIDPVGRKMVVEQTAKISMSPLEAKMVLSSLATSIKQYEDQFGEILVPKVLSSALSSFAPPKQT